MNKELKEAWEEHKDPVQDGPWGPSGDFKGGFWAAKDANKNIFNLVSKGDHTDIFIYAFRYALGRLTYSTSTMQDAIRAAWPDLSQQDKKLIKKEIKEHQENIEIDSLERQGHLQEIDLSWMALLELED